MSNFIPVNEPLLDGKEKQYLAECIDTGWIGSDGAFVKRFEQDMAHYVGKKYAVAVTNGTAALELAVVAMGIGAGDEVIMPAFTIISCAQAVVKAGATPVLVDSDATTFNMQTSAIKSRITPKTKAIMVVHIYGLPVDMLPIIELAKKYNLKIIEDSAQSLGQTYCGKQCGSFGDISTFSFYPNKHISTGEGGMVLSDDEHLFQRCKTYHNLCFSNDAKQRFIHQDLGWNLRMSNLQAALGVAQLEKIEEHLEKKRVIGRMYQDLLADITAIQLPLPQTDCAYNLYWVFALVLRDDFPVDAQAVCTQLAQHGIGTRPFFYPMHLQPVFNKRGLFVNESYPVAEKLYNKGFYIPSGLSLTVSQIEKVAKTLHEVLR